MLLDRGRVVADGLPAEVLSDAHLARVFGIRVWRGDQDGPLLVPLEVVR